MFPVLANVSSMPNFSTILNDFQRVHLDHQIGYYSQFIRPDQNLPEYPADYALETSEAALRFITYGNGSEKQAALIGYAQSGIDHYHMALGGTVWDPNGGYGNGRKMPVLFAGIVLNNSNIMNWTMNSTSVMPTIFGEEGHMYFGRNIGLYGTWYQASDSGYWNNVVNDVGGRDIRDPYNYIDGGERPAGSYQPIVSNPSIPSLLLLLSYPRARTLWNNDSFVYYNLRYFNNGGFTSFDICAPADGLCVGGSNNGGYCNTAGENGTSCGTDADTQSCNSYCGGGGYCNNSASWSNYNLTYGLNATTNTCIVDSNLADGIGRFPGRNRFNDTSAYSSTFGQAMWGQNIQGYFNDTSAPTSIIVSPSNGSTVTSNTTFFAINLTDTGGLARSLLYVWNSTGSLIRYNYSEISGNNTLVNRSVVLPSTGVYYWNYYTTDMYGNQRFNNSNYTVTFSSAVSDTTSPVVNLVAPTNNTYVSLAVNSFNATFTDDVNVSNATLYIWNVTGATINTTVRALSGTSASANITFSFPYNGTFYWNYRASDNSSNAAMNSSNFTIVYDALSPFVNYTSPTENNSTNLSRSYVLINVTATDTNLANITINLFNTTSLINSTTTSTSPNYVNITVPRDGIYYFNATATDLANNKNSTSTRTVNVTVDTTSPSVSLNAPANNTLTSLSTQSFNATFADNLNLSNATLYIWNSTSGVVNNTNRTLTGTAASLNITVTLPYSDRFYWNYIVSDTVGNFASNHTNFTIVYDAVTPGVTLVAPANGSQSLINNVTFNATFTDNFALRNATLFIWNSSLAVINQTGRTINGTANGVNITVTLPYQGTFYWNYFAVDNATNSAMNSSNFTLIFNSTDTTSPVVTVNLPTATTYSSSTLAFNVSLNENGSVRFSLDNGVTNNSMTGDQGIFGTDFNYTQTSISNGDYVFRVYANDTVGNMNRTANVSFTVSVSSGSSGGGSGGGGGGDGGGGGASSSNATTIWIVTFNDTAKILDEQGVGRFLGRLERTLINISGKVHYVGVLSLTTLNASIEVASIPQKATLNIGQSKLFEVNEDNYYDLNVTILSIADSKAAISVTAIHLLIPGRVEENESVIGEPSESVEESDKGYMKYFNFVMENYIPFIVNNYLFFVIGFVVLLIIILIIIRRKNHTQNKIDGLVNRIAREHTHVNHHVTHPIHHVHSKEHSSVKSHIPEKHDKNSKK